MPTLDINDRKILCQHYLRILYRDAHIKTTKDKQDVAKTYGEILYPSIDKLLSILTLTNDDVFMDLGSGLGKLVLQVFLNSPVQEACGIEIIPELHHHALQAAQSMQNDLPEFYVGGRKLTFLLGDFFEIPLHPATVVLICSPCFSQDMLLALGRIINHTPSIHTVLTLRPLATLQRLAFKKTLRVECSWDTALCYVYGGRNL